MKGKRSNNWKWMLTGWIFAVLLSGTINHFPEIPLKNPEGTVAQTVEGQGSPEGELGIQSYGEEEENFPTKN